MKLGTLGVSGQAYHKEPSVLDFVRFKRILYAS